MTSLINIKKHQEKLLKPDKLVMLTELIKTILNEEIKAHEKTSTKTIN